MENSELYETPQAAGQSKPKTAMGITSLVLGILALASSWMPIMNNASAILAVLGVIFGIVGIVGVVRGKKSGKGLAIAGVVLNVAAFVVVLATQSAYSAAFDDALNGPAATSTTQATADASASANDAANASEKEDFSNLAVGTVATLENGVAVSVDSVETGLVNYDGGTITAVHVTYSNGSSQEQSFNVYDWKAQDAQGALRNTGFYSEAGNEQLNSGSLAAGGTVSGVIYFDGDIVKVNYYASMLSDSATAAWALA